MKKLLITTLLLISTTAMAQHHHGHWERRGGGWGWVAPAVVGGVIGYGLAQPRTVVVQQPVPVYYPNTYPPVPYGYHYEQIVDANCNCYRWVLVPNQ